MGFKDRFFQEGLRNNQLDKTNEEFAESDSSQTKLGQLLDRYKNGKTLSSPEVTDDFKVRSEYTPTESDGSVGVKSNTASLISTQENRSSVSDIKKEEGKDNIEDSPDTSTEDKREIVTFEKNGIKYELNNEPIFEEELGDIFDIQLEDPGYVSEKVLDYEDSDYITEGVHDIKWKKGSIEGTEENVAFKANDSPVLCQWSHPGFTGSYFCEPDTKYENLQLQDIQEKREQKFYEVVKDLPMEKSVINNQEFLDNVSFDKTYQYVPLIKNEKEDRPMTAKELVEAGYLKEVQNKNN